MLSIIRISHLFFAPATLSTFRIGVVIFALATLSACGGGGTGGTGAADNGGIGGTGVSTGVMTKGSVILNGVRYEDSTANIVIDDTPKTIADLRNGMVVQVLGTVSADGVNGTATRVEAQIEVRGTVTSVDAAANPQSFVVLGQIVFIDDLTVLSNLVAPITNGLVTTLVEVHGLRDATGNVLATRVEANTLQMGDSTVDEIRGVVSGGGIGSNPITFTLGGQLVNASGALISPAGATYQDGSLVEVHCNVRPCVSGGVFQASRIEVESAEDAIFTPGLSERFEVEGLISEFVLGATSFSVAGVPVQLTGSPQFKGGISTDLANDIKVEAEGTWNGSVLVANKIEFKRSVVRLQGQVTGSTPPSFTLNIIGVGVVTVEADDFTTGDFAGGAVPPVSTACIQVRGNRKAGGGVAVIAGEIKNGCSGSSGTRHLIQAPVEVESGTMLTLLGFAIDVGSPIGNPPYENLDGSAMTQSQFFDAVVAANPGPPSTAGTLVKVSFDTPSPTVLQVELED